MDRLTQHEPRPKDKTKQLRDEAEKLKDFFRECRVILTDIRLDKTIQIFGNKAKLKNTTKQTKDVGRKKYSCYVCFAKFATQNELKNHQVLHENDNQSTSDDEDETPLSKLITSQPDTEKDESSDMSDLVILTSDVSLDGQEGVSPSTSNTVTNQKDVEPNNFTSEQPISHDSPKMYSCVACSMHFANQAEVKAHAHTQNYCRYFCSICARYFNTRGGFIVHIMQHELKKAAEKNSNPMQLLYKCQSCSKTFTDCFQLKRHFASAHPLENIIHSYAVSEYPQQDDTKTSTAQDDAGGSSTGPSIFSCDLCFDVFSSRECFKKHTDEHNRLDKLNTIVIEDEYSEPIEIRDDNSKSNDSLSLGDIGNTNKWAKLTRIYEPDGSKKASPTSTPVAWTPILPKQPNPQAPSLPTVPQESVPQDNTKLTSVIKEMINKYASPRPTMKFLPELPAKRNKKKIPRLKVTQTSQRLNMLNPPPLISTSAALGTNTFTTNSVFSPNVGYEVPNSSTPAINAVPQMSYFMINPQNQPTSTGANADNMLTTGNSRYILYAPSASNVPSAGSPNYTISSQPGTSNLGQNQLIFNQQINSGNVVVNPQTQTGPYIINAEDEGNIAAMNIPTSYSSGPILQNVLQNTGNPFQSAQSTSAPQLMYFIVPSNSDLLTSTVGPPIPALRPVTNSIVEQDQQVAKPSAAESLMPKLYTKKTKSTAKPKEKINKVKTPKSTNLVSILKTRTDESINKAPDEVSETPMKLPVISNVHHVVESSDLDNSEPIVMPIITNITSVNEDSNDLSTKPPPKKNPVSVYENEFAKFLKNKPQDEKREAYHLSRKHYRSLIRESSDSDELVIDEGISAEKTAQSKEGRKTDTGEKPKIFVKKLCDLQMEPSRCDTCDKNSWGYGSLTHLSKVKKCEQCEFYSCSISRIRKHYTVHKLYHCRICNFVSQGESQFAQHNFEIHTCKFCMTFPSDNHVCGAVGYSNNLETDTDIV